jgi:hypothetical protein
VSRRRTEDKVSVVAKVRGSAEGLYQQAKARYADSETMQRAGKRAGKRAGEAAAQARRAAGQGAGQAGQAAGHLKERVKDLAGKTSSAVRDARSRAAAHK